EDGVVPRMLKVGALTASGRIITADPRSRGCELDRWPSRELLHDPRGFEQLPQLDSAGKVTTVSPPPATRLHRFRRLCRRKSLWPASVLKNRPNSVPQKTRF